MTAAIAAPPAMRAALHVGWQPLLGDVSLDFQLQRWAAYGGPRWVADVRPVVAQLRAYDGWCASFVTLGERAEAEGRALDAALHFRSAEFFMLPSDPRKEPLRRRLLPMLRDASGVSEDARREVPFGALRLPVWQFPAAQPTGTIVTFGGFDSYIEELFPLLVALRDRGWSVLGFEGPGQGSVLEEQGAPMIRDWHLPVAAVLDAFGVVDATLIGLSLGGCLAIRAAAFEPRIRRVVCFDVLTDLFACMAPQQPTASAVALRAFLALGADGLVNRLARAAARRRPVAEWGLARAMHVFGCDRPADALRAARAYHTRDHSARVAQDVLVLAGAEDHYVPRAQLAQQARLLTSARSVTTRLFTAEEHAAAHCQVGNLPLAIRVIADWIASHPTS